MVSRVTRLALATAAGLACLFVNVNWASSGRSTLITQADARVGRPLTPVSVAGVHRRAARRAYRGAGYYGGGYYGLEGHSPAYDGGAYPEQGYYRPAYYAGAGLAASGTFAAEAAATGAELAAPAAAPAPATYPEWAPSFVHNAIPVEPGASATVTDPATGRMCTISTSGYHWCWTP